MPPASTEFITVSDAAKFLHVSRKTVYVWAANGKLKTFKLAGRLIRIRVADVTKLLRERNTRS